MGGWESVGGGSRGRIGRGDLGWVCRREGSREERRREGGLEGERLREIY